MFDYYVSFRNQTNVGSIGCWIGPLTVKLYVVQGVRTRCEGVEMCSQGGLLAFYTAEQETSTKKGCITKDLFP